MYSFDNVVNLTFIAAKGLFGYAYKGATTPKYVFQKGTYVGVCYSWVKYNGFYWLMFVDDNDSSGNTFFYVPFTEDSFNISDLVEQGLLSTEQKLAAQKASEAYDNKTWLGQLLDDAGNTAANTASTIFSNIFDKVKPYLPLVIGGAVLYFGITSNKSNKK